MPQPLRPLFAVLAAGLMVCSLGFHGQANAQQLPANTPQAEGNLPQAEGNLPQAEAGPAQRIRYWTTNWSFDSIDIRNLLGRLRQFGIEIPVEAEGEVSVRFTVSVPLNALRDAKAYRFDGTLTSPSLQLESLLLRQLNTRLAYKQGVLQLTELTTGWGDLQTTAADQAAGTLTGTASLQLVPSGQFAGQFTAESLALRPLYELFTAASSAAEPALRGFVSGQLAFEVPLEAVDVPRAWTANANLRGDRLGFGDSLALTAVTGPVFLNDGRLQAESLRLGAVDDSSIRLAASLDVNLIEARDFNLRVRGNDLPLASLARLATLEDSVPLAGKLDLDLQAEGRLGDQLGPNSQWQFSGRVASPDLTAFGVQLGLIQHDLEFNENTFRLANRLSTVPPGMLLERLQSSYRWAEEALSLQQLDAELFGGSLSGSAELALVDGGSHRLVLSWQSLQPQLAGQDWWLPADVRLRLTTSGEIDWLVPANQLQQPAAHQGTAQVVLDNIVLNEAPLGNAELTLTADQGRLELSGRGELFGGSFTVDTATELAQQTQIDVSATLSQFVWQGNALARRLQLDLQLTPEQLRVVTLSGEVGGGRVLVSGSIPLPAEGEALAGQLRARLAGVDLQSVLGSLWKEGDSWAGGRLTGAVIIQLATQVTARGNLQLRDARLSTFALGNARASLTATAATDLRGWSIRLGSITSSLQGGELFGDARLDSSSGRPGAIDLASTWEAKRFDFDRLMNPLSQQVGGYARGQIDGKLILTGRAIQSVADLRGVLDARLSNTAARAVPGLIGAQAYLGSLSLVGTQFDSGRLRGTIGSGIFRLDQFWLLSDRARVSASGAVNLANASLKVDALISTGNFEAQNLALMSIAEAVALPATPISVLIRINRALSDRNIYVTLRGPLTRPSVRLQSLRTLREATAGYLLREATAALLPVPVPGAVGLAQQ
ncbi:AsmA-like C-terminal region-containing protein [Planctomycetaceae bacterium SH139]